MKAFISIILLVTLGLFGCEQSAHSPQGFSLPEGDVERGEWVFTKYECMSCHTIGGMHQKDDAQMDIPLGGEVTKVKTYADLVTSIINPSHKLARGYLEEQVSDDGVSKMVIYNHVMTVQELVDVVSFLQPKYELVPYTKTSYPVYPYMYH